MNTLVIVVNYYADKLSYLKTVVEQLQHLKGDVDIYLFTKHSDDLGLTGVTVMQGSTYEDWQYPWTVRPFILDHANDYDLFVVCDDDVLITPEHVDAFLEEANRLSPEYYIPGFLVVEQHPESGIWYTINMHTSFKPAIRGYHDIADKTYFTPVNVHSAMFMATQAHLRRVVESGNFGITPMRWAEPELGFSEFAMSNVYINCGLTKLIPCDRIAQFCVHHLPNKFVQYGNTWGGRLYAMDEVHQMTQARLCDLPTS